MSGVRSLPIALRMAPGIDMARISSGAYAGLSDATADDSSDDVTIDEP